MESSTKDRPVLYTKKTASVWGQSILPHLLIKHSGGGLQRGFISELRQAMHDANSSRNV